MGAEGFQNRQKTRQREVWISTFSLVEAKRTDLCNEENRYDISKIVGHVKSNNRIDKASTLSESS